MPNDGVKAGGGPKSSRFGLEILKELKVQSESSLKFFNSLVIGESSLESIGYLSSSLVLIFIDSILKCVMNLHILLNKTSFFLF